MMKMKKLISQMNMEREQIRSSAMKIYILTYRLEIIVIRLFVYLMKMNQI